MLVKLIIKLLIRVTNIKIPINFGQWNSDIFSLEFYKLYLSKIGRYTFETESLQLIVVKQQISIQIHIFRDGIYMKINGSASSNFLQFPLMKTKEISRRKQSKRRRREAKLEAARRQNQRANETIIRAWSTKTVSLVPSDLLITRPWTDARVCHAQYFIARRPINRRSIIARVRPRTVSSVAEGETKNPSGDQRETKWTSVFPNFEIYFEIFTVSPCQQRGNKLKQIKTRHFCGEYDLCSRRSNKVNLPGRFDSLFESNTR